MPDTEYEDSIEKFRPVNQMGPGGPGGPVGPIGPGGPVGPSRPLQQMPGQQGGNTQQEQPSAEQIAMIQQQRAMQQQAMQQQAMQQQAMQQQAMQQQAMQQQAMQQQAMKQKNGSSDKKPTKFLEKLKRLKNNDTLQEIFIIAILFIIFSTSFYKNNLSKIPFVTNENNCLNTIGLLISAILIAIIFVIVRTFL